MANYMHIFWEKWNVLLIVKPFHLINLIRLITFLGFRDNDVMSFTRDGRGWVGHLYCLKVMHVEALNPEIESPNPFKSIYH